MGDDLLVLFPGALGDFVCFLPTLSALRSQHRGRVAVVAQPSQLSLLSPTQFQRISLHRREVADLFGASPLSVTTHDLFSGFARVMSWTGYGDANFANRLATATQAVTNVYRFRPTPLDVHASAYYADCAGATPAQARITISIDALLWARQVWRTIEPHAPALLVHAGSGSKRKNWDGMRALVVRWRSEGGRAVLLVGPADDPPHVDADIVIRDEPLDHVAALIQLAPLYLGNDSGISHLAGLLGTCGVVVFGPTDPIVWKPIGPSLHVAHAAPTCDRCGPQVLCCHRLSIDTVFQLLTQSGTVPRPIQTTR